MADKFGQADVAQHSFTEKLDLSSATGRMFYDILGSFAQADQFGEEQARLTIETDNLEADTTAAVVEQLRDEDLRQWFEEIVAILDRINVEAIWQAATEDERRKLLDELLDSVTLLPRPTRGQNARSATVAGGAR